jgi:hypothetical protein
LIILPWKLDCCYPFAIFTNTNLSASKIITKTTKTKQVKNLLSKIKSLALQFYADKFYVIIQTPTEDMIADTLTKSKDPYNYASIEANRLGVYEG